MGLKIKNVLTKLNLKELIGFKMMMLSPGEKIWRGKKKTIFLLYFTLISL